VNWWQTIRYDLKTITSTGWSPTLIPDSYLIEAFFQAEIKAIEGLEGRHSEAEAHLSEAVEAVEYEAGEDEDVTPKAIKAYLKTQIEDLKASSSAIALAECETLQEQLNQIKAAETSVKRIREEIKQLKAALQKKIDWKRDGTEEEIEYVRNLMAQAERETVEVVANPPQNRQSIRSHGRKLAALERGQREAQSATSRASELQSYHARRIEKADFAKLYDLINNELMRYLNAEKRAIIGVFEDLWIGTPCQRGQSRASARQR